MQQWHGMCTTYIVDIQTIIVLILFQTHQQIYTFLKSMLLY